MGLEIRPNAEFGIFSLNKKRLKKDMTAVF